MNKKPRPVCRRGLRTGLIAAIVAPVAFSTLAVATPQAAQAAEAKQEIQSLPAGQVAVNPIDVMTGVMNVGKLINQGKKNVEAGNPFFTDAATAEAKKVSGQVQALSEQMQMSYDQVKGQMDEIGKQISDASRKQAYAKIEKMIHYTVKANYSFQNLAESAPLVNTGDKVKLRDEYGNITREIQPRLGPGVPDADNFQIQVVDWFERATEDLLENGPKSGETGAVSPVAAAEKLFQGIGGEIGQPANPGFLAESWSYLRHDWAPRTGQTESKMVVYPGPMRQQMNDLVNYYNDLQATFGATSLAYLELKGQTQAASALLNFVENGSPTIRGLNGQLKTFAMADGFVGQNDVVIKMKNGKTIGLSNKTGQALPKKNATVHKADLDAALNGISDGGLQFSKLQEKLPQALPKGEWFTFSDGALAKDVPFREEHLMPVPPKEWKLTFTQATNPYGHNMLIKVNINDSKPNFPDKYLKSYDKYDFAKGWTQNVNSGAEPVWDSYTWNTFVGPDGRGWRADIGPGLFVKQFQGTESGTANVFYKNGVKADPDMTK
ncbi:MAG TPA: hypothetical protein DCQ04_00065 [Actinobacteria bacterium]|nr:hypothetical protein [Actinomycetota bacterium]